MFVKKNGGKLTGWLAYTYAKTEVRVNDQIPENSINNGAWFPANYDKTHNLSVVTKLAVGKKSAFGALVTYNTGRPITAITSTYTAGQTTVPNFSGRNQYRIPYYLRLDLSFTIADNIWKHRKGRDLEKRRYKDELTFSIYNVLGRKNAYSVFYALPEEFFITPQPHRLSVLGSAFPSLTYNFRF